MINIDDEFPKGLLRPELFLGVASSISARSVSVNLSSAGQPSGSHYSGGRYGRGEVGEFILIEGQQNILLGRITEVKLREPERRSIRPDYVGREDLDAVGQIQLLGCISMHDLRITAGVDAYPRLGDRIYAAPHHYISLFPLLMEKKGSEPGITLELGHIDAAGESKVFVKPEKLFGRHCAILGATGGGKSWTTAKIIEECIKHQSKIILLDATGEYHGFSGGLIKNCHLGSVVARAENSEECSLPPSSFVESDFIALFEPSGKVQGPKLRAAIESLRLVQVDTSLATDGILVKEHKERLPILRALAKHADKVQNPSQPFNVKLLPRQIIAECVQDYGDTHWKGRNDQEVGWCAALIARINSVFKSPVFDCVFSANDKPSVTSKIEEFMSGSHRLLRVCLSGIGHEFKAREIIANTIGRFLLSKARAGDFHNTPVIVIVDEAHNFLGRYAGSEDHLAKLDSFEIIAKEGRKYGLNICLATQRPRDITEGVLSQMGTLIVHRLTNEQDRHVVERACGEIDRAASDFLPNLRPGEAAIIGVDFPIPLTVQIQKPVNKPHSEGPNYQKNWAIRTS